MSNHIILRQYGAGPEGKSGFNGWTPEFAVIEDGERRVQQIVDWSGGQGDKPIVGLFVGPDGLVENYADATDIRGPTGADGPPVGDGDITTNKLADGAVTENKLADASVATDKLANLSVTTSKLDDNAVTANKLASGAVTTDKLSDFSITTAKLANNTVTQGKLSDDVIRKLTPIGEIKLLPFRPDEFPEGWYYPSGDYFPLTSDIGKVLASFSENFKWDWGIIEDGNGNIRLLDPAKFFATDGAGNTVGRFPRLVDGVTRFPGSTQNDAIRPAQGTINFRQYGVNAIRQPNTVFQHVNTSIVAGALTAGATNGNTTDVIFNIAGAMATANEIRPFEFGMTPAIFLGV